MPNWQVPAPPPLRLLCRDHDRHHNKALFRCLALEAFGHVPRKKPLRYTADYGVLVEGTLLVRLFLVLHTDMWNQSVIVLIHHYSLIQWYRCCSWGRNLHFSLFIPCIGTERVRPLTSVGYVYHFLSVVVTEKIISINLHHSHDWRFIIHLSFSSCVLNFDNWKGNDVVLL